jgi:hypothetical protein
MRTNKPNRTVEKEISARVGKLANELLMLLRARKAGVDDIFYSNDANALVKLQSEIDGWSF